MPSAEHRGTSRELFAAHQIAQGIVLVQIEGGVFTLGFRDAVELPVAGVGIGQNRAIGISGGLGASLILT